MCKGLLQLPLCRCSLSICLRACGFVHEALGVDLLVNCVECRAWKLVSTHGGLMGLLMCGHVLLDFAMYAHVLKLYVSVSSAGVCTCFAGIWHASDHGSVALAVSSVCVCCFVVPLLRVVLARLYKWNCYR